MLRIGDANSRLARLSQGPSWIARGYTKYRVNGYEFSTSDHENRLITQNSGISMDAITYCRASTKDHNWSETNLTYFGVIRQILQLDYVEFKETVFYCDWVRVEDKTGCKVDPATNMILVNLTKLKSKDHVKDEPFVCASQKIKQVFYSKYLNNDPWSVVLHSPQRLTTEVDKIEAPVEFQSILNDNPKLRELLIWD